ncbi:MAG: PriCT-2 domain-containing protein, partial [Candidatus Fonsibacter sp.]
MIFKKLGAPVSLWEEVSKRSNKYKRGDCIERWNSLNTQLFSIGSHPSWQRRATPRSFSEPSR